MNELYRDLADPAMRPTLRGLLDSAVDMASLHHYYSADRPYRLNPESDNDEYDPALLELVLYGHGRAQLESNGEYTELASLSWSKPAQQGTRRMARRLDISAMQDFANARVFTNPSEQVRAYDAMVEKIKVISGPPLEASNSIEYGARVAIREIVLDIEPIRDYI